MWCANCQADVAAEVTPDNRHVHCASCGSPISTSQNLRGTVRTREARELLERWSNDRLLDPYVPMPEIGTASGSDSKDEAKDSAAAGSAPAATKEKERREEKRPTAEETHSAANVVIRFDEQHLSQATATTAADLPASAQQKIDEPPQPPVQTVHETPVSSAPRIHVAHDIGVPPPHFNIQLAVQKAAKRQWNWPGLGQFLAYAGAGGLTIGTTLSLWGYFAGPESYVPAGWLITTFSQMLLFLGVVTLVSGGMDQTTREVARRIDQLGERLIRIERVLQPGAVRGPSISAEKLSDTLPHTPQTKDEFSRLQT